MGTMSLCSRSRRRGLSQIFLCLSDIVSPNTSSCLEMDGIPFLMTSGVRFLDCFLYRLLRHHQNGVSLEVGTKLL